VRILRVRLQAAAESVDALDRFYDGAEHTVLEFEPVAGARPFYHFALRVPRNRFDAAREWLAARVALLPDRETGSTTFEFEFWNAQACYALDPGDNIVELIAHRELPDESPVEGPFSAAELLGVCEVGVVGPDRRAMATALEPFGIELWSGDLDSPGGLAFIGGRDGVLILSEPDRGWMPTGRAAEIWPVDVLVEGPYEASVALPGTSHRVQTVPA
jgi:hypothetical protein